MASTSNSAALAALGADDAISPSIWEAAAHNPIPEDAWEYHMRKALNDSAYNNLSYQPYCSTMPVPKKCDAPQFAWKRKEGR